MNKRVVALVNLSAVSACMLAGCGGGGGGASTPGEAAVPPSGAPFPADRQAIARSLGETPAACADNPGRELVRTTVSDDARGRIDRIQIQSCGKVVHLYEAIPAGASVQTPVVIALHQTVDEGKDEVMGFRGSPALSYGRTFFEAGFIVVAPDAFVAGENFDPTDPWSTAPFYREFPQWSAMGRMLQDHLATSTFVQGRHGLGCTAIVGHSLGGHNALMLALFDPSVDAVVSSGGFESMVTDDNAVRWADLSLFTYMPLLDPYVKLPAPRQVPWDWDGVLGLIERPTLVVQGAADRVWTHPESAQALVERLKAANPAVLLEGEFHAGGHVFGPDLQAEAMEFVRRACP